LRLQGPPDKSPFQALRLPRRNAAKAAVHRALPRRLHFLAAAHALFEIADCFAAILLKRMGCCNGFMEKQLLSPPDPLGRSMLREGRFVSTGVPCGMVMKCWGFAVKNGEFRDPSGPICASSYVVLSGKRRFYPARFTNKFFVG